MCRGTQAATVARAWRVGQVKCDEGLCLLSVCVCVILSPTVEQCVRVRVRMRVLACDCACMRDSVSRREVSCTLTLVTCHRAQASRTRASSKPSHPVRGEAARADHFDRGALVDNHTQLHACITQVCLTSPQRRGSTCLPLCSLCAGEQAHTKR